MGFLDLWAKFSFVGYGINERKRGKQIASRQYEYVMAEKEQMEKQLKALDNIESGLIDEIDKHKAALALRPKIAGRDDFLDDRGLSPSQLRSKQLKVLDTVATYDKMFDTEMESLQSACAIRDNWCAKLDCSVTIKKKKLDGAAVDGIRRQLGDEVDCDNLFYVIAHGGRLKETFVFNDAQIIVDILANYGIKAKAVSTTAQADVEADSEMRDPEDDLPKIAKCRRFALAGIWLLFFIVGTILNSIGDNGFDITLFILAVGGALVIFFLHWLLTRPIVALAVKIVEAIFKRGGDMTKDSATYLRGIFLTDIFDKGLDTLDNGLLKYVDGINENYGVYRKWALAFLTPKVLDELLYEVIDQMTTGASFNNAINNAEAKADRRLAAKRQEEHNKRMEMEKARHNIEMEKQARARAEYARQCANNAAAAAQAMRDLASAQQDTARAENEKVEELKKIRRDLQE